MKNAVRTLLVIVFFGLFPGCVVGFLASQGLGSVLGLNWLNTSPQNTVTAVLNEIQALSQLTTTRYNYSVIVTSTRDMPPLLAALYGESLSLVAAGNITAGIDLGQLTPQSIVVGDDVVVVSLPPPTLMDCFLDESESYVVRRDTGLFASPSPQLDNEARRYAVEQLRVLALENGILDRAQQQASEVIMRLAYLFEGKTIQVIVSPPDPAAPLPASCE